MKKKSAPAKGDHVTWSTSNGQTEGTVIEKVTKPTKIKNFTVNATQDDPKLVVKSSKSGAKAAHRPDALKKIEP